METEKYLRANRAVNGDFKYRTELLGSAFS